MKKLILPISAIMAILLLGFILTFNKAQAKAGISFKQSKKVKGFTTDIEKQTRENNNFRKVLYTAKHMQLVLMSLKPNEDIGEEVHPETDQFFRFESGNGKCIINSTEYIIKAGDLVIIPAGSKHNIINTDSQKELKLYTIYAPPQHKDAITRSTKKEAETNEAKFDGKTTE